MDRSGVGLDRGFSAWRGPLETARLFEVAKHPSSGVSGEPGMVACFRWTGRAAVVGLLALGLLTLLDTTLSGIAPTPVSGGSLYAVSCEYDGRLLGVHVGANRTTLLVRVQPRNGLFAEWLVVQPNGRVGAPDAGIYIGDPWMEDLLPVPRTQVRCTAAPLVTVNTICLSGAACEPSGIHADNGPDVVIDEIQRERSRMALLLTVFNAKMVTGGTGIWDLAGDSLHIVRDGKPFRVIRLTGYEPESIVLSLPFPKRELVVQVWDSSGVGPWSTICV